jgi:hypothetical protein
MATLLEGVRREESSVSVMRGRVGPGMVAIVSAAGIACAPTPADMDGRAEAAYENDSLMAGAVATVVVLAVLAATLLPRRKLARGPLTLPRRCHAKGETCE